MSPDFKNYVGIKHIKAKPATWAEAQAVLNRPVSEKDPAPDTPGYLTQDTDGYLSWSPKDTFDEAHFENSGYCDYCAALDRIDALFDKI